MKRIKVYLDTNMIHDFFVNQAIYIKKREEIKIPKKFQFIIASTEKVGFVTSFLTKAEIVRELVSAHSLEYEEISIVWKEFLEATECRYVSNFEFNENIIDIVAKIKMRLRTLLNFFHLYIAIRENAYFVSGDKDIVRKVNESKIYGKAITYEQLRKFVEGDI